MKEGDGTLLCSPSVSGPDIATIPVTDTLLCPHLPQCRLKHAEGKENTLQFFLNNSDFGKRPEMVSTMVCSSEGVIVGNFFHEAI